MPPPMQARENHELARAEVRKAKDTEVAAAEKLADLQQSVQVGKRLTTK